MAPEDTKKVVRLKIDYVPTSVQITRMKHDNNCQVITTYLGNFVVSVMNNVGRIFLIRIAACELLTHPHAHILCVLVSLTACQQGPL